MKTAEELMPGGRWLSVPGNIHDVSCSDLGRKLKQTAQRLQRLPGKERHIGVVEQYLCISPANQNFPSSNNNRWECFGYYRQDQNLKITSERRVASSPSAAPVMSKTLKDLAAPARHVSTSVSSGGQAYNTFSNLVQVDIKPIVDTYKPTEARSLKLCLNVNSWQNEPIKSTAKQNGTEDAEQRKRKEAKVAAAAYAAQDRCDSCSDSE
ncbi:hypothetical protein KCU61_g3198, partial [Aureobasidium melanogenum]